MHAFRVMTPVHRWPASERPRERLLAQGPEGMSDGELLALVLGCGSLEAARALLAELGGLRGLARARPGELMRVPGIGAARACALAASVELARRLESVALLRGDPIGCAEDVHRALRRRVAAVEQETFWLIALDGRHRVLALRQVAQGGATSVEVHPRQVFDVVLREGASALVVAHNHPSGDPEPSAQDRELTNRLRQGAELLGLRLLDHVVTASGGFVSLAARGLL